MSTVSCQQCVKAERDWDHRDCGCVCHELPGEWERIAFHFHQFDHGCHFQHCRESDRLYAAWQAALAKSGERARVPGPS
jgi:hypothetical protein